MELALIYEKLYLNFCLKATRQNSKVLETNDSHTEELWDFLRKSWFCFPNAVPNGQCGGLVAPIIVLQMSATKKVIASYWLNEDK